MVDLSHSLSPALGNKHLANQFASITATPATSRISLRAHGADVKKIEKLLGFKLPTQPKSTTQSSGVFALWIGPDEWFLYSQENHLSLIHI